MSQRYTRGTLGAQIVKFWSTMDGRERILYSIWYVMDLVTLASITVFPARLHSAVNTQTHPSMPMPIDCSHVIPLPLARCISTTELCSDWTLEISQRTV